MNKENVLIILWVIFGFIFISGIDSILYFIVYLIYFGQSELGLPYEIMKYSMPIIALILYVLTTFLIYKKLKLNSNSSGIYLTKFPKRIFIALALIALALNSITHKLSGLYAEHASRMENIDTSGFLQAYGWMTTGIYFSRLLIILILSIFFIKKLNLIENKN
jgi:ABC-type Fe3+-siderophore transport system permease subunit